MTAAVNANFVEDVGESRRVYSRTTSARLRSGGIPERGTGIHVYMDHAGLNLIEPRLGPRSLRYTYVSVYMYTYT